MRLEHDTVQVRLEVHDEDPTGPPPPRKTSQQVKGSGRGIGIEQALADDVTVQLENDGTIVQATRADRQLRDSGSQLHPPGARLVLAQRNDWFKDKVSVALRAQGVEIIAQFDNGADAVGIIVAEQPDLLLVEDRLPMIGGTEVIRQARQFSPRTIVVAHTADDQEASALIIAGARAAFSRRVPPGDVAQELLRVVRI